MRIKGTPDSCKLTLKDEWFIICNICVIICGYFGFSQHAVIQRGYERNGGECMSDTEDRDDRDFDVLEDDQNTSDAPSTDKDDDFDYLKEIEAIEAQERELEEQRQKKKAELDKLRAEHAKEEHKRSVQRKREMKERKKEAEWLGEPFDDDVETVPVQKKKSKKGIAAIVIIILIAIGAGSGYAYKMQMDKKTVADFEQKVASFQSEKLDGRDFGTHQSYFTDFMKECQDAIDAGDLKQITELNKQWSEVENTYTTVANGKTSLDAFVSGMDQALSTYSITDTYKKNYETLKKDAEKAQKDCDYEKVSDFQKQLDALATNLKADNMKAIQNLKNDISSTDLDKDYVSSDDQKKLDAYSKKVDQYTKEEDYAQAINTLNSWKKEVVSIKKSIEQQKAEEQARAESEAAAKRAAESRAAESRAAESRAAESKAADTKKNQTSETKNNSNSNNNNSSSNGSSSGYVLPNSSSSYLSAADVKNLSSYQLMIARNEIYARHGRKFNDSELQAYFNSKSWYKGTVNPEDFSTSVFNDYEIQNIELIQSYE